jgi:hypothetical protein
MSAEDNTLYKVVKPYDGWSEKLRQLSIFCSYHEWTSYREIYDGFADRKGFDNPDWQHTGKMFDKIVDNLDQFLEELVKDGYFMRQGGDSQCCMKLMASQIHIFA